jgi:3-oxoadipate enol-lactonase
MTEQQDTTMQFEQANQRNKTYTTRDGTDLTYQVFGPERPQRYIMLCNGLGGRYYIWYLLIRALVADGAQVLIWDYRGTFSSGRPGRRKSLSIIRHAEDAIELLDHEGIAQADFIGWSMGSQVALEAAAEHPQRVNRLVILNGMHGHAMQTAFQPLLRMPYLAGHLNRLIEYLQNHARLHQGITRLAQKPVIREMLPNLVTRLTGSTYRGESLRAYIQDVFDPSHMPNLLRLFQELDAHSVFHLLPDIEQETLVIAGIEDPLTPAYVSRELARRMPNARYKGLHGMHLLLIERPTKTIHLIRTFIASGT